MKMLGLAIITLFSFFKVYLAGENYAVLVCGSNSFLNYRHQADIAHAYTLLLKKGIKRENIITMSYDDVPRNRQNKYYNKLFNNPDMKTDYYKELYQHIDYTRDDVNPEFFIGVITGNQSAVPEGKPVLKSTSEDNVFINFVDHGGVGLIAFPMLKDLLAEDLEAALKYMSEKKMFKNLLLYVEACESGSMFENILPDNERVLAITAANPKESSYACYYNNKLGIYLGDVFSVEWMENCDASDLTKKTIMDQYKELKKETKTSHIKIYGEMDLADMKLSDFMGSKKTDEKTFDRVNMDEFVAVPSREADLYAVSSRYQKYVNDPEVREEIIEEMYEILKIRREIVKSFKQIFNSVSLMSNIDVTFDEIKVMEADNFKNTECYRQLRYVYQKSCYNGQEAPQVNEYSRILRNLCHLEALETENLVKIVESTCSAIRA